MPGPGTEFRFEPTVAGALRRYWWLVLGLMVLGGIGALGFSLLQSKQYTSQASLAIPPPTSQQLLGSSAAGTTNEYVAGQVATLRSPQVAIIAAKIVNSKLHKGPSATVIEKNAVISPPITAGNGSSATQAATATVAYTAKKPRVAADTVNAILTAYGEVRANELTDQAKAAESNLTASVNSINTQLSGITGQISALQSQATQTGLAQQKALISEGARSAKTIATQNANLQALLAQQSALDKQQTDLVAHENDIEANLQQALAQPLSDVPAVPTQSPSSPQTLRNVGIGLLALLLVGVLVAYIVALRRRRFSGRHEPESLYQAPLLGDVPRFQAERITSALPVTANPMSATAESFRFLAASIGATLRPHEYRPAVFTSAIPGSGKTTMSANIATALAERGWDVLAIDGDFIHRDLTAVLLESDRVADPGLSEVLMGQVSLEQAAQLVPVAHGARLGSLCVLAPGASGHLLPGLAASYDPGEFQAKICQPYDAVIIDGPPLAGVAYAADLASLVGNIIIVVNHDDLVGPQLDFIDQLQATSGHIIGYIYNRAPLRKDFASYYRDQYDSYGRPAQAAAPNETTDTATDTRSTTGSTATLLAERPGPGPSPETATSKAPGADPNGAPGTPGHPTEGRR